MSHYKVRNRNCALSGTKAVLRIEKHLADTTKQGIIQCNGIKIQRKTVIYEEIYVEQYVKPEPTETYRITGHFPRD